MSYDDWTPEHPYDLSLEERVPLDYYDDYNENLGEEEDE